MLSLICNSASNRKIIFCLNTHYLYRNLVLEFSVMNKTFLIFLLVLWAFGFSSCDKPNQFTPGQQELIMASDTSQAMRVWSIANTEDSLLLRQKSKQVIPDSTDEVLQALVHRLYKTVTDSVSLGVGISAPQVGILKQVIWVQRFDKSGFPFEFYLNPRIRQYSALTQECREGCLSIPDRMDTLNSRSYAVLLEYQSMDGQQHVEMVEDFTAVIFQHEIDHLNGILYTDHLEAEVQAENSSK